MATRKPAAAAPARSLRWALLPVGALGVVACLWFGLPVGVFLLALVVAFGWLEPPPELTGRKTSVGGAAEPANGTEVYRQQQYQSAQMLRFAGFGWSPEEARLKRFAGTAAGPARLATGSEKAKSLGQSVLGRFGLNPLQSTTIALLPVAVAAWFAPLMTDIDLWWVRALSSVGAGVTLVGASSAQRTALLLPGVSVETLFGDSRSRTISIAAFVAVAPVAAIASLMVAGPVWPFVSAAAIAAGVAASGLAGRSRSRVQWSQDVAARDEWLGRWQLLLPKGAAPSCLGTSTVGPFRRTTFAPAGAQAASSLLAVSSQLPNVMGGIEAVMVPTLDGSTSVDVIEWVEAEWPDVSDPTTPEEVVQATVEAALATGLGPMGIFPKVEGVHSLHDEESKTALWGAQLSGADFDSLRRQPGWDARSMVAGIFEFTAFEHDPSAGGPILIFGSPDASMPDSVRSALDRIATEDGWTSAWLTSLGTKMNSPTLLHQYGATETTADGQTITRTVFALRQGETLQRVLVASTEEKLRTSAPGEGNSRPSWLTCAGWLPSGVRPGERHDIAFCVYSSQQAAPRSPAMISAGAGSKHTAAQWLLSGMFNDAFDQARLPRPEVYQVRPVAVADRPRARVSAGGGRSGTIWQVSVRLYGSSFADIRGAQQRLTRFMGAEWMRVVDEPAEPGCVSFYVGVPPRADMRWLRPKDEQYVRGLDWEQAWVDSGVRGVAAAVPVLTGSAPLPGNDRVLSLDFKLPAGVDRDMIVKAKPKLKAATGNGFIDVRTGAGDASTIQLLVAESDPMPTAVMLADHLDSDPLPFAVDVTGAEVAYDTREAPMMAVLGSTGSGKSVATQVLVLGRLAAGSELFIADPMKGAADFRNLRPYARAFVVPEANEDGSMKDLEALLECEALLAYVHDEMRRRVGINSRFGCDYRSTPPEHSYPPMTLLIDEFESLITSSIAVGKQSDDPEIEAERMSAVLWNAALAKLLTYVGKVAREGRSAGITMILSGQKLTAMDLEKVGLKTLKNNLGRILMGITTWGDRSSSLIEPEKAADLGDSVPPGRGLYEPRIGDRAGKGAMAVQVVYADKASTELVLAGIPVADPVDLSPYRRAVDAHAPAVEEISLDDVAPVGTAEHHLDPVELSLDDLLVFVDDEKPAEAEPDTVPEPQTVPDSEFDWGTGVLAETTHASAPAELEW